MNINTKIKNKFRIELFITPEPTKYNSFEDGTRVKMKNLKGEIITDYRFHILECKKVSGGYNYYLYPKQYRNVGRNWGWVWFNIEPLSMKELLDESFSNYQVKDKDMFIIYEQIHSTEISNRK